MQRMRLHMMYQTISTPLTYLNEEKGFWRDLTCHMKEHVCPLKEKYTLRIFWIIYLMILNFTAHYFTVKIFKKQLNESW